LGFRPCWPGQEADSKYNKAVSLKRLLAISLKELKHITRDIRTILLVIISPPFLLVIMSSIFGLEVKSINYGVMDLDRTELSRRFVQKISAVRGYQYRGEVGSYQEAYELLRKGSLDLVLVIGPGFSSRIERGEEATIQALVDGMDPIEAIGTFYDLQGIVKAYEDGLSSAPTSAFKPLQLLYRARYNPGLDSTTSLIPGLMAIVLTLPAMALALSLSKEWETGTFEALAASPLKGLEYLFGKLLAYLAVGLVSAFITLGVAVVWFKVPFKGSLADFLLFCLDFFLASMGVGLFIGQSVKSQQSTMFLTLLYFIVPSFFIAGLVLPLSIKEGAQLELLASYALCTTHFIKACRGIMLKGLGITQMADSALALAAIGLISIGIGFASFRKRIG